MAEPTVPAAPAGSSPANHVTGPRFAELKHEYNLRHKTLVRYSAAPVSAVPTALPAPPADDSER